MGQKGPPGRKSEKTARADSLTDFELGALAQFGRIRPNYLEVEPKKVRLRALHYKLCPERWFAPRKKDCWSKAPWRPPGGPRGPVALKRNARSFIGKRAPTRSKGSSGPFALVWVPLFLSVFRSTLSLTETLIKKGSTHRVRPSRTPANARYIAPLAAPAPGVAKPRTIEPAA